MNLLESQVLEKMKVLSQEKQQEVLDFVEFLISRATPQASSIELPQPLESSFVEAARQYVGCTEGPGDLSTNPNYMEGYGT
ncbi:hypothetical protein XM38_039530 [Halomicronema hongdechloris C2206]|uniref:Uncharacterized protein n=1 Tax=Halomicronema hongdechloris C2206 TaxID=1641165 RepID=A0A1V8NLK9_9CYAN|nr:DUF2281 domain-containing protein [Halomicronema hongdechloris]ASC72992.1 hypothetical protein XM38_039530 [Halomicronema hongdechloris C2206]